jgi:hypothetical protein
LCLKDKRSSRRGAEGGSNEGEDADGVVGGRRYSQLICRAAGVARAVTVEHVDRLGISCLLGQEGTNIKYLLENYCGGMNSRC